MRLLGLSGSLRRGSYNARLVRAAAELLPPPAELVVYERLRAVPPYDADLDADPWPAGARDLRDAVADAHALLIATPEYNHSVPGQLKNAIDWLSRPAGASVLRNVPVAVAGASTGQFGAVWAQAELRKVLGATGARVLDRELGVALADHAFDGAGRLVDAALVDAFAGLVGELVSEAERSLLAA
ncbi:MAG TPA: NADPH-dependent FMN reductase [Solirubrobacterales bacterium]|nr:NADPH-dependent FMN reductase [Solirubrobacterales bacterium]